jgi:predicted RNA-binding Zn-ribbon protein involved in translation (DUF1610 family)
MKSLFPNIEDEDLELRIPTITEEEVPKLGKKTLHDIIVNLKNKKANGADKIPNRLIKILNEENPELLILIFQKCLKFLIYPENWKQGKLVLLNKPDKDPSDPKSYRPITLLSTFGKVLEKIIISFLTSEIERNEIYHYNQYAYRRGHSTEGAVLKVHNTIKDFTIKYKGILLLSFDISGAFDHIKWSAIISELDKNNVSKGLKTIIIQYLKNRTVKYFHESGKITHKLKAGVPRGSCLGAILFNICMSKIHKLITNTNMEVVSYADDIAIVAGLNSVKEIKEVNEYILKMQGVVESLGLKFNEKKTIGLVISKMRKKNRIALKQLILDNIKVNNKPIKIETHLKYLGVIIDENLNYTKHIDYISNKIVKRFNCFLALYGNTYGYSFKNRVTLYKAIYESYIDYCSLAYANHLTKGQVKKLLKVQRKILLGVISAYRTVSYTSIWCIAGMTPIDLKIKERLEIKKIKNFRKWKDLTYEDKGLIIEAKENTLNIWQDRYDTAVTGRTTYQFLPNVKARVKMKHFYTNFVTTQFLSGHGNFGSYLNKMKIIESSTCNECNLGIDTVTHTVFECPKWNDHRIERKIKC